MTEDRIKNILLVEDDQDFANLLLSKLEIKGLDCDIAASISEAKEKLCQNKYKLISLDVFLGEGNCAEIVKYLQESKEHMNAEAEMIILSSRVNEEFKERMAAKSIQAFSKMTDLDTYLKQAEALGSRKMQEHMDLIFDAMDGMEDSDELAHLTIDLPELAS